ncbi:MAG: hypothetical protein HOG49_22820 [Candidatus Scalindua sp.]|jgi:hypothetical protein|nr:hypothetical protein [Candidatus Scalindua sp.]
MKKDDLYIAILKHGYDKIREGVTYNDVRKHLMGLGHDVGPEPKEGASLCFRLFQENFSDPMGQGRGVTVETTCFINMDAYFRYLEYIELKEARSSSKTATYFAIIAITISIIAMGFSIYFSYKQLISPTKIEAAQFEKIEGWINKK